MKKDIYSDALILSEGRYEARERRQISELEIEIEPLKKSKLLRISPLVVKRIAALKPLNG